MRYLLDTSAVLGHVYGHRPTTTLVGRLVDEGGELCTTDVVMIECLSRGTEAERAVIGDFLDALTYIPITPAVAREAAAIQRSTGPGLAEALLAAAAASVDATLVRLPPG